MFRLFKDLRTLKPPSKTFRKLMTLPPFRNKNQNNSQMALRSRKKSFINMNTMIECLSYYSYSPIFDILHRALYRSRVLQYKLLIDKPNVFAVNLSIWSCLVFESKVKKTLGCVRQENVAFIAW